eukprot:6332364-Alexandrium_andersonii.AAC.1
MVGEEPPAGISGRPLVHAEDQQRLRKQRLGRCSWVGREGAEAAPCQKGEHVVQSPELLVSGFASHQPCVVGACGLLSAAAFAALSTGVRRLRGLEPGRLQLSPAVAGLV